MTFKRRIGGRPCLLKIESLNGEKPEGHPELMYNENGELVIAENQVWVEMGTHELWRVDLIRKTHRGRIVIDLMGHGARSILRSVSENTLWGCFRIWEKQAEIERSLRAKDLGSAPEKNSAPRLELVAGETSAVETKAPSWISPLFDRSR